MEGVGVLHGEFASAHQSESRAQLVAELGLDLVEIDGELAIGVHRIANGVGDDLLGGGGIDEVPVAAILDAQQFSSVQFPASRFHP